MRHKAYHTQHLPGMLKICAQAQAQEAEENYSNGTIACDVEENDSNDTIANSQNYNQKLNNKNMLSNNDIMVDKDAFEEVIENDLKDMKETDVKARHLFEAWCCCLCMVSFVVCCCVYNNIIDDL